jgi:hypothetical protein
MLQAHEISYPTLQNLPTNQNTLWGRRQAGLQLHMLVQSIERFVAMGISLQSKRRHQRRIDQQTFTPSTENLTCQRIFQHIGLITTYSTLCTQLQHMTPENNKDNIELLQSSMAIVDSNQRPKNLPVKLHMPAGEPHSLLESGPA